MEGVMRYYLHELENYHFEQRSFISFMHVLVLLMVQKAIIVEPWRKIYNMLNWNGLAIESLNYIL